LPGGSGQEGGEANAARRREANLQRVGKGRSPKAKFSRKEGSVRQGKNHEKLRKGEKDTDYLQRKDKKGLGGTLGPRVPFSENAERNGGLKGGEE